MAGHKRDDSALLVRRRSSQTVSWQSESRDSQTQVTARWRNLGAWKGVMQQRWFHRRLASLDCACHQRHESRATPERQQGIYGNSRLEELHRLHEVHAKHRLSVLTGFSGRATVVSFALRSRTHLISGYAGPACTESEASKRR